MVPVSAAHEIYPKRPGELLKLLLMPGSQDQCEDIERHMVMLIDFLNTVMSPDRTGLYI
ncbi:MAG: hypothetical protein H6R16_3375 [Proteobacteria bacterium]|nr:hypothetical protein [Pseudomonadota bacterium]